MSQKPEETSVFVTGEWWFLSESNFVFQGVKLIFFFSDSHLAPKFFKVVANSKKVGYHF